MNKNYFLECLSSTGIDTGVSILGLYSLPSGDSLLSFNQLFATGDNYFAGLPYRSALPLIYNGVGQQPSGSFNKSGFYQLADVFKGSFASLISFNYSGCLNNGSLNYLLASTTPTPASDISGVYLGITPTNRLFVKTNNYSFTIPKEIGVGDFAHFSVFENRFLHFGLFSMADNTFYDKKYDFGYSGLTIKDLCFGGALNYPALFTGYSGKINEVYLFGATLESGTIKKCVDCSFATGSYTFSSSTPYYTTQITGSFWTGVQSVQVTGYSQVQSPYTKYDGTTGYVYYDSGLSGNVTTNQILIPQTSRVLENVTTSGVGFIFDNSKRMNGALFDIFFDAGLYSGDLVEVYSYSSFNENVNLPIQDNSYPSAGFPQVFCNGLAETSGVDYGVNFGNKMVGFDSSDILIYDNSSPTKSAILPETYSGTTVPFQTGYMTVFSSGTDWINFYKVSGATFPYYLPNVIFPYDVYLNGQKLADGINFVASGHDFGPLFRPSFLIISGAGLISSFNNLSDLSEFKLIPKQQSLPIVTSYQMTQNQSYISGVSGFSHQVWVNGMRQTQSVDYFKTPRCKSCTGNFVNPDYSMVLYDSSVDTIGFFN